MHIQLRSFNNRTLTLGNWRQNMSSETGRINGYIVDVKPSTADNYSGLCFIHDHAVWSVRNIKDRWWKWKRRIHFHADNGKWRTFTHDRINSIRRGSSSEEIAHDISYVEPQGGCAIATVSVAHMPISAEHILTILRTFRRGWLESHYIGLWLSRRYEHCSPPVAKWLQSRPRTSRAFLYIFIVPCKYVLECSEQWHPAPLLLARLIAMCWYIFSTLTAMALYYGHRAFRSM